MRSLSTLPRSAYRTASPVRVPHLPVAGHAQEQEADQAAAWALAGATRPVAPTQDSAPRPQQGPAAPPSVQAALAEAGEPLAPTLRQEMGRRFAHDFSQVRVHTGATAARSAQALDAQAYTHGERIVFAPGRYAPDAPRGRYLLAHELTHVVQQSRGPGPLLQRQDAKAVVPTEADADDLAGAADSPLREQLVHSMNDFMDAIVGDPVYEAAMKKVTWDKKKSEEAQARFDRNVGILIEVLQTGKVGKKPPLAITTTCIALQQALITGLDDIELRLGAFQKALGPTAKLVGEGLGTDVWHEARPNMTERPKRGDIYVLEFQNAKVVQLVQYLAGLQLEEQQGEEKSERLGGQRETLRAQIREYDPETAPKGTPKPQAWREGILDAQIAKLQAKQARLDAQFTTATAKLEAARGTAAEERERNASHPLRKKKNLPDFEFSHVGYVVSIKKMPDADQRGGAGAAQERWLTFDGGQRVKSRGDKEGSTQVARIYHPETNEITGEAQQRMGPRLLKGWLDVDKLVGKPPPPAAKKAGAK